MERICNHGRPPSRCFECARETFLPSESPDEIASGIGRRVGVELAAISNYVAWLERRLREMESEREDTRKAMAA